MARERTNSSEYTAPLGRLLLSIVLLLLLGLGFVDHVAQALCVGRGCVRTVSLGDFVHQRVPVVQNAAGGRPVRAKPTIVQKWQFIADLAEKAHGEPNTKVGFA